MTPQNLLKNENVLQFFVADRTLVSASVIAVNIFEVSGFLTIELDVILLYSKTEKNYRIKFEDIIEYAFYYKNDRYFYYITNLKFFKEANAFYISLDPDDSVNSRSEADNDFILSNKISSFPIE